ncbi:SpoIIE family protein phosphatase [Streptomyces prasinus]|uniref:SpoIIE family protein phosphatase n=1 Tax=Streptomyces prasinus TaxID=67345 RepID=UPI002F412A0A
MEEAAAPPAGERPGDRRLPGPATGGAGDEGRIEDVLAQPLVAAVEALGGYGGLVYLRSRDRRSLVLCVVAGMPRSLLRPWWRVPVGAALPMAEAYRSGKRLWLPDERATMLRFPQFTAALPYSFASAHQPVSVGGETVGVLVVLRSAAREPLGEAAVVRVLHDAGRSTEERLAGFVRRAPGPVAADTDTGTGASAAADTVAHRTEYDGQPVGVRLPSPPAHPLRLGMVEWDLDSDRWWADDEALALLGLAREDFDGTTAGVEANALYPVTAFTLAPGSVLALYTDGLVEQPGSDIGTGIEAVRRAFAHSGADSVEELADQLVGPARGVEDRPDDVALLLTAYRRAPGA